MPMTNRQQAHNHMKRGERREDRLMLSEKDRKKVTGRVCGESI